MRITLTSFRDSITLPGMKFSIDKKVPAACMYPTIGFLTLPKIRGQVDITSSTEENIYDNILSANGKKLRELLQMLYENVVDEVVFADWQTAADSRPSHSIYVGRYLEEMNAEAELEFSIEVVYRDGRERL